MVIGLISDTHGLLRPAALQALVGSDLIVHAGDIGDESLLTQLASVSPVVAVRGNADKGEWARRLPTSEAVEVRAGWLYVLHDLADLDLDPSVAGFRVVVAGHTHRPKIERRGDVLYVNPGSAGPARLDLPVTVARLDIDGGELRPTLIELPR